jgi:hypothetical protein
VGDTRGTTRAEVGVTEQTVYDWSGHYLTTFSEELTVTVRRLKMSGRPLNKPRHPDRTFDGVGDPYQGRDRSRAAADRAELGTVPAVSG